MRLVTPLLALALVPTAVFAGAPFDPIKARAAYVCQALISNVPPDAAVRPANVLGQRFQELRDKVIAQFSADRRLRLALTLGRIRSDLMVVQAGRFAAKQELVGEAAIRDYLQRVRRDAEAAEAAHVPEDARQPFETKNMMIKDLAATFTAIAVTGIWGYLTSEMYHAGHPFLGLIPAYMTVRTITSSVVPFVTNVVRNVKNALILRAHRRGRPVEGMTSADLRDRPFEHFASEVLMTLKKEDLADQAPLWAHSSIPVPLSRSATTYWLNQREVPTAERIGAAVRRSGDFVMPADPRRLDVDHLFFYDLELKAPVLLTLIRERRAH